MTKQSLDKAVTEANRFIRAAKLAIDSQSDPLVTWMCPTKENGAVKRASMDLTRALAEMRKP